MNPWPTLDQSSHCEPCPEAAWPLVAYWAWKFGFSIFYDPIGPCFQTFCSADMPNGISSGLYVLGSEKPIKVPVDPALKAIHERPYEFTSARLNVPAAQIRFFTF